MTIRKTIATFGAACLALSAWAYPLNIADGDVEVQFDPVSKTLSYTHKGKPVATGSFITATLSDGREIDSRNYPVVTLNKN
ncbi:MAG: hypothetical protein K2G29_04060, partial [Muribaculaceae bacterium]|nr:hypothetical protein [Muribaculaceae bacterium]